MVWSVPSVSGTCPPALAAHGSAVIGTSVYMFGGWSPSETGPVAQDTLYCLRTGKESSWLQGSIQYWKKSLPLCQLISKHYL